MQVTSSTTETPTVTSVPETVLANNVGDNIAEGGDLTVKSPENDFKRDMLKYKDRLAEREDELKALKAEIAQKKEQAMVENEQWKQLYEGAKVELDKSVQTNQELKGSIVHNYKLDRVKNVALKAGLLDVALNDLHLVDLDSVIVETSENGVPVVHGHDELVNKLKSEKPHWFKQAKVPTINNTPAGQVVPEGKSLSPMEVLKLQRENPSAYKQYMQKQLKK